jgi:hypothetical protein
MASRSIAIPDATYERMQTAAAAEGTTVEILTAKALERDLPRRWLNRVGGEGDVPRGKMSDADVETLVECAVQESRARR